MSSKNQTEETQKAATSKNSNGQPANVPPTVVPNSSKNKENKMANKKHQHTQDGKTSQDGKKKRGNSPKRRPMNFGPHNEDTLYPSNASKISPKIENRNFHDGQNGGTGSGQFSSNNKNTTSPYPVYYNGTVVRNGPNCPQQLMSQNSMFGRLPDQRPRYHHHQGFLNTNHGNNKHYTASNNQMFVPQGFSNFNGGGSYTRSPPAGGYQHQRNFEWNNRSLEEFNNANNNRKKRYNFQRKQMNGASTENLVQIKTTTNILLGTSPRITESPPTSPSRLTPPSPVGYDSDRSSCRSHRSLSEERSSPSLHLLSQSSSSTSSSSCMLMEPTSPSMLKNTRSDSQLHVSSYPYHHATGGYNNGGWSSHVGGGGGGGGGSGSSHQYNQGSGYPSRSTFDTTSIGILLDKDGAMDGNAIGYYPKTPTYDMQQQQMKARDRNANSKGVLTSNKSQNSLLDDSNYMKSYSYVVRFHQVPQSLAQQQQQPQNDSKPQQILADKFLARSHLLTMRNPPQSLLSHTVWDGVSQSIWNKFYSAQQSVDMYTKKIKLWKQLYSALKEMDQRYELFVVGSTISGFGTDLSDIDMCVVQNNKTTSTRQEESTKLQEIKAHLKSLPDFEGSCVIEARVPILRFKHSKTGVEIDMNFNNPIGIRNTHLLYSYCQMDWRLRPLVLLVKAWAQHNNINDARHSSLSSYSLVLMVIHYLQCGVSPPILPCLHDKYPHKFQDSTDVTAIDMNEELPPYHSENRLPLGQLFYGFLAYFSTFDYKYSAVSVREGKVVPRHVCTNEKSDKNEPRQWKLICIQEPFDKTNTAHSVHDTHVFDRILLTFAHSAKLLHDTKDIDKLFQKEPFYHAIQFGTVPAFPELYVQKDTMYLRA